MLSYPTPDVYWQDVFPAPEPTFLTGVPIVLGYALAGPINEPTALYLWPQFEATFGQPYPNGYLSYAVRGFFENGGLMAYVVRLDDDEALSRQQSLRAGLEAAGSLDNIDLIYAPDVVRPTDLSAADQLASVVAMQTDMLNHCRLLGNRFAILDTPLTTATADILTQSSQLNDRYGALYHPWLVVSGQAGQAITIPPGGHVAGLVARSDQQVGVQKAPANEVLEGVLDLHRHLTKSEQVELFAGHVNYLRAFTGRGIRVWGARTLSDEPEWQQVNVQRLFITVGRWLEQFMTQLPFEPNGPRLWVGISREIAAFMKALFEQGALKGQLADQAFYVKCDAEINPPEVRDAGMVVAEIGLAAAMPGEFMVVKVVHGSSGVSITAGPP
jgi:phage tail sheath protein FI